MNKPKKKVKRVLLNPAVGGVVKTIKANYYKINYTNFIHQRNFCATGVIEVWEDEQ